MGAECCGSKPSCGQGQPGCIVPRLAIMMFIQFFVWGAWYVAMWGFNSASGMGDYNAAAYTVAAIAAIASPLFVGLIADRFFRSERILGVLHIVGAVLLYIAPSLAKDPVKDVTFFGQFTHPYILVLLAYMLCFMPTISLTCSLSFKHLTNSEKQFPVVRVLGTIGWIAGNWVMWGCRACGSDATAFADGSSNIFKAAAIASALLGLYAFSLPATPPAMKGQSTSIGKLLGLDALVLLKDKAFLVFIVGSFLICIPLAGYYSSGYGYVASKKVELFGSSAGAMSLGQMSEIFFMLIIPFCFARLGVKWMLVIGMLAWAVRYALFSFGFNHDATAAIFVAIALHGICYDFFFVTGMIYTDKKAPVAIRNQAQGFLVLVTQGLGLGIGAQAFGWLTKHCTTEDKLGVKSMDYETFWIFPAIFAAGVMLMFIALFWDKTVKAEEPAPGDAPKAD